MSVSLNFTRLGGMDIDKFCFFQTLCKRALRQGQPKQPATAGAREKAGSQRSKNTVSKYYLETPAITATTTSNVGLFVRLQERLY